ncbi:MAG TPA: hypothetical protein HPP81_06710 [Deltaproteobacteria bacterium]|jgi:hypothetical protein|nr:hypothetical protein [Deltaproteobacteria bacterium]
MDIVKVIALLMIVFVIAFGGVLLVHTSRLEKEIKEEISPGGEVRKIHEDAGDEV